MGRDYIPIRVSTLRGDQPIAFDAYVRVAGKYILFCREGDSFEGQRLERLRAKKLQKMWIHREQESHYRRYLSENIARAYSAGKGKSIEMRAQIIQGQLQATAEELMEDLSNDGTYKVALESVRQFAQFVINEPEAMGAILQIKNNDFSVSHHGVTVATLALGILEELGLHESRAMQLNNFLVGCLIHDLEHNFNNINLAVAPEALSKSEYKIYRRHSENGVERILKNHFYDKMVADIVGFHEETVDGSGLRGFKEKDLDQMVFVAGTANCFDHYLQYENLDPKDALKNILIDKMGIYPLEIMKALQDSLKKRGII